ncbi:MAG: DUF5615 family PIN-like protein [Thermoanaerobaculia bacterium]|nr:DUF5615 family PIN-like protein [Thermoanaerobaculia bacterium]
MAFFVDESVDAQVVAALRSHGFGVLYVAELTPGIADDEVLSQANQEHALLLTADKDFGELVYRQGQIAAGVVLIRLAGLAAETKARMVVSAVLKHAERLMSSFSVISPGSIRIRSQILPHGDPDDEGA